MATLEVYRQPVWMRHWGAESLKRTLLWSNSDAVRHLSLGKLLKDCMHVLSYERLFLSRSRSSFPVRSNGGAPCLWSSLMLMEVAGTGATESRSASNSRSSLSGPGSSLHL